MLCKITQMQTIDQKSIKYQNGKKDSPTRNAMKLS
jgi:hypothetical protein